MYKTKIDWCDTSWNPVTGCLHGCEYCYAQGIANRFGGYSKELASEYQTPIQVYSSCGVIAALRYPLLKHTSRGEAKAPYPFDFDPTLHRYRLGDPAKWSEPRTIFVCSMADLFGDWVPDEWIQEVFAACEAAPQHRYLFLTKNPRRLRELYTAKALPYADNYWFGTTITKPGDSFTWFKDTPYHTFISIEPILEPFGPMDSEQWPEWVIVGAETGKRKDKVVPDKDWIDVIASECKETGTPIFMKNSLRDLMGDDFRQEYPWEVA